MANTVLRLPLSGSTQGKGIKIAATTTPGTMLHTTGVTLTVLDVLWIYLTNSDVTAKKVTVEFGGVAVPDDNIELVIPAESGLTLCVPGLMLTGTGGAGNIVRAFCPTANVVVAFGYVDRVTP
jgi:hypothetical protein